MEVLVRDATLTSIGLSVMAAAGVFARRRITVRASLNSQLMSLPARSVCKAWAMLYWPFRASACTPSTSLVV
ncbi:hypothetical protein D3C76_1172510 [compost metagenome]